MSNEKSLAIIPRTMQEVQTLADVFAKSSLLPDALRGKAADVFVSIMAGQELGLPPMAALRGVHVVQGKPILAADTMVAVVLGSGLCEYFVCIEDSQTSATYETKRKGAPTPQRCTWTVEDAKRAQLIKDGGNWQRHPRAMCKARAKAMLARDVYPDVLAGCYEEDEGREFTPAPTGQRAAPPRAEAPTDNAIDAPSQTPIFDSLDLDNVATTLIGDIDTAPTVADIDSLAPRFIALPKGTPQRARAYEAFKARRARLGEPENPVVAAQGSAA